jgi:hypothetical protein
MSRVVVLLITLFLVPLVTSAAPVKVTFQGANSGQRWTLAELNPDLPADFTGYNFLVLEMRASSPQRFELQLITAGARGGTTTIGKTIHPFSNVWVRAAIPLRFYREPAGSAVDLAATFNQPRNSYWINIHSGPTGPLTNVQALAVNMRDAVGSPTLEIRSVTLAREDPGDAVLDPKPVVDEFGQWMPEDWPGKAKSLEDLRAAWAQEQAGLATPAAALNRCPYGGFKDAPARATGFFRVEQIEGKWWLICPDGHLFYSTGVNGVGMGSATRTTGREDIFAALPAGRGRGGGGTVSHYTLNVQRRLGQDYTAAWQELTRQRFAAWGLNTLGSWSTAVPRIPTTAILRWQLGPAIMNLPDVYAPDFAQRVDQAAAQQLANRRDDPWLLGYFIGNEPPWPGRESQLVDMILAGNAGPMQTRLREFLAAGDTPARRRQFVYEAFGVYLKTINDACKRHAPNHLNLGIRFGGSIADDIVRLAAGFDVYSTNIYAYVPARNTLDRIAELTGRPILIGEFHIGTPGRGLASGLVQAASQEERGVAYRYYVETCAGHPSLVGTHWFQWVDQPATGRNDGENYNIGYVDVTDRPYPELVEAARTTHARLLDVHSGKEPPVTRRARVN